MAGGDRATHTQLSPSAAMRARNVSTPTAADLEAAERLTEASMSARGGRPPRRGERSPDRSARHRPTPADLMPPAHPEPPGRSGNSPEDSNDVS